MGCPAWHPTCFAVCSRNTKARPKQHMGRYGHGVGIGWDDWGDDFDTRTWARRSTGPRHGDGFAGATSLILAVAVLIGLLLSFGVVIQQMGVAACSGSPDSCDFTLLGVTTWITPGATALTIASTTAVLAVRKHIRSWWVPALGILLELAAFVLASALVRQAIHM